MKGGGIPMKILKDHVVLDDGKVVLYSQIGKVEVKVPTVRAKGMDSAQDAVVHLFSGSIAHGNEKVNVILSFGMKDGSCVEEKINTELLTKGSLDYHSCVKRAREMEQKIDALRKQE